MTAATFNQTNFNTQDPASYKGTIDGDWAVAQQIVDQFAPHALATPIMKVALDPGSIFSGTTLTQVGAYTVGTTNSTTSVTITGSTAGISNGMLVVGAGIPANTTATISGTSVTLSNAATATATGVSLQFCQLTSNFTAPASGNSRIDRVVVSASTGVLSVITGTPTTGTPTVPAITSGNLPVCQVALNSSTTALANTNLTDERNLWGLANGVVGSAQLASGAAASNVGTLGGSLAGTLPNPTIAASGVTGGSYTNANLTIGTDGRITSASSGSPGVTYNAIAGCLPSSLAGTNTTATLSVSTGQAADATNSVYLNSAGYSWAVSNGNAINGYSAGTTLTNSTTIHFYLCTGTSGTGVYAIPQSVYPIVAVQAPSGYNTYIRHIFSLLTNSSGAFIAGTASETEGGSMTFYYSSAYIQDVNAFALGASRSLLTLSVPTGFKLIAYGRLSMSVSGSGIVCSPDEPDVAVGTTSTNPGYDFASGTGATQDVRIATLTNTSAQIAARAAGSSTTIYVWTSGYKDFRRI